jgi:hypothetical protein
MSKPQLTPIKLLNPNTPTIRSKKKKELHKNIKKQIFKPTLFSPFQSPW